MGTKSTDKWRSKYLDVLDEQDREKKRSQDRIDLLRRGLLQFSIELEGKSDALDQTLAEFRNLLRDEEWPSIQRRLDQIARIVEALESSKQQSFTQFQKHLASWEKEIAEVPLPRHEMKQLKKWRKSIKKRMRWESERQAILSEIVSLATHVSTFQRAPEACSDQSQGGRQGLWSIFQVFTKSDKDTPPKSDGLLGDERDENLHAASLDPDSDDLDDLDKSAGTQTLIALTEAMCRLISRIRFDETLNLKASLLYNRLDAGIQLHELLPAFEEMVELVLAVVGTEQEDFQSFLTRLSQRLDALQTLVIEAGESQGNFSEESRRWSEKIQQQMEDLKAEFTQKGPVDASAQQPILTKMDALMSAVRSFLLKGSERNEELNQQLEQLTQQVQTLEQQANEAQQQLEEQQQQALLDPLTQVPNRQAYNQRIEQEYLRFKRYQNDLALLVLDIDHFKQINDEYGHLAGDKVLQLIARTIQKALRETDFLARYGGEEFVVLLPEIKESKVQEVAEKIRALVESCPFRFKKIPVTVTLSIGGSFLTKKDTPESLFERADQALYQCKHEGRNRWRLV